MATGLKSRVIYRQKAADPTEENYWAGEYKLLVKAKSIPSPFGSPNMVDTSTLEDLVEIQEAGRKTANTMEISGAMEKAYLDELIELENQELDIMILYGTDGKGSIGKLAFIGTESIAPDEATDDHLTMTTTISTKTQPVWVTDDYEVTVAEDANGYPTSITVTAVGI